MTHVNSGEKIGGGNKMGSAGASINAKRKAQKQARDARGESDPIVSRITAFVDKLAGKEASDDSTTERTSDYRTPKERRNRERMAGQEISSVFGTSTLDGTLMAMNQGPSTPVKFYPGMGYAPNPGATRVNNVRPKGIASFPQA